MKYIVFALVLWIVFMIHDAYAASRALTLLFPEGRKWRITLRYYASLVVLLVIFVFFNPFLDVRLLGLGP